MSEESRTPEESKKMRKYTDDVASVLRRSSREKAAALYRKREAHYRGLAESQGYIGVGKLGVDFKREADYYAEKATEEECEED